MMAAWEKLSFSFLCKESFYIYLLVLSPEETSRRSLSGGGGKGKLYQDLAFSLS